jgi:hypothetical protein
MRPGGAGHALWVLTLLVFASITLFSAPVTWNEIFLTASLKDITRFSSMPPAAETLAVFDSLISIPKAQHYPPWLTLSLATLATSTDALKWVSASLAQEPQVLALRIFALALAIASCFGLLRIISFNNTREHTFYKTSQLSLFLAKSAPCALLLFFARVGAAEQLLVILSLVLLWFHSERSLHDAHTALQRRLFLSAAAGLLALSSSVTWIYSIATAALLYGLLYRPQGSWLKQQLLWFVALGIAFFSLLFLLLSSYEGLVHTFTLRWLYEYDMRHSSWGWPGSSVLFRIVACSLMFAALRRTIIFLRKAEALQVPEAFLVLLTLSAGVFLGFRQINPTIEDLLLQCGVFFLSRYVRITHTTPMTALRNPRSPLLAATLRSTERLIFFAQWFLAASFGAACIALLALPTAPALPELQVWLSALQNAINAEKVAFTALGLGVLGIAALLLYCSRKASELRPSAWLLAFVLMLHFGSFVRTHCLWDQYKRLTQEIPDSTTFLYLPPLAPFVALNTSKHKKHMVVPAQSGDAGEAPQDTTVLVLPAHLSDLCQAMDWKVEASHGIFSVCTLRPGSLWKLVLLN